MKESKLILLLKTFDDIELRGFDKFVRSPFFNQKEEVVNLYRVIRKAAPDFAPEKMAREKVMGKLYPGKAFNEKKYKYLSNLLLKIAERFITMRETESRPLIQEYHLLNACVKRDLEKNYNFIFRQTTKKHLASIHRDSDFYYKQYLLNNVAAEHFDKKKIRRNNEHIKKLIDSLDIYYFANKLKHTCHLLNNQQIVGGESGLKFVEEMIGFLEQGDYDDYPAVFIYYNLYRLLSEGGIDYFEKLKELLSGCRELFSISELKELYLIIINYCIRQFRTNRNPDYFLAELYRTYQLGIRSSILLEDGYLSPWTYKNVVKIGLRLGEPDDTEKFIIENNGKIKKEFQSDALYYNMAEIHYHRKSYGASLDNLNKVGMNDIYYSLDTKIMISKIYYETEEYDSLESLLSSFRNYIRRNKLIGGNVKDTYLNFAKCLARILNAKGTKKELRKMVEDMSPLAEQKWLLEQCG